MGVTVLYFLPANRLLQNQGKSLLFFALPGLVADHQIIKGQYNRTST